MCFTMGFVGIRRDEIVAHKQDQVGVAQKRVRLYAQSYYFCSLVFMSDSE